MSAQFRSPFIFQLLARTFFFIKSISGYYYKRHCGKGLMDGVGSCPHWKCVHQLCKKDMIFVCLYSPFWCRATNHAFLTWMFFTPLWRTIKNSGQAGSGREDRLEKIITKWKRNKNLKMRSFCAIFDCSNRAHRKKKRQV